MMINHFRKLFSMGALSDGESDDLKLQILEYLAEDSERERSQKELARALHRPTKHITAATTDLVLGGMLTMRQCDLMRADVYKITAGGLQLLQPQETADVAEDSETAAPDGLRGPSLKFLQAPTTLVFAWAENGTGDGEKEVVAWGFHHHYPHGGPSLLVTDLAGGVIGTFRDNAEVLAALPPEAPDEFGRRLVTVYIGQPLEELPAKLRTRRDVTNVPTVVSGPPPGLR